MRPPPKLHLLSTALLTVLLGSSPVFGQTPTATEERESRDDAREDATPTPPAPEQSPDGPIVVPPPGVSYNHPEANRGREIQADNPWSSEERRLAAQIVENLTDSITLAGVAGPLATRPEVRAFAERVEREQRPVNREFTDRARIMEARPSGSQSSQRRAARLADQRGPELDRAYLERFQEINQETAELLNKLEAATQDDELKKVVTRTRPLIEAQTRTSGQLVSD